MVDFPTLPAPVLVFFNDWQFQFHNKASGMPGGALAIGGRDDDRSNHKFNQNPLKYV